MTKLSFNTTHFAPPAQVLEAAETKAEEPEVLEVAAAQPEVVEVEAVQPPQNPTFLTAVEELVEIIYPHVSLDTMKPHVRALYDLLIAAPPNSRSLVRQNHTLLSKIRAIAYGINWNSEEYPSRWNGNEILRDYTFLF